MYGELMPGLNERDTIQELNDLINQESAKTKLRRLTVSWP